MIRFNCKTCGDQLEVDDALAGRKTTCPNCKNVTDIPYPDFFSFGCPSCGGELEVSADSMGKMIKCPHCGQSTFAPSKKGSGGQVAGCFTSIIAFLLVTAGVFAAVILRL